MPLAIELAAARLRSMSLDSLHDRLDQRFRLLTGGSRTALERQQTLRAAVSWSYELLTSPEQLLLQRLSALAAGFDLETAEAVCGFGDIAAFDVAELLGSLVDKSLVIAERAGDAVGYRLLETIREFAAERLAAGGEQEADAVAAAHCAHFLNLAEAAGPRPNGGEQAAWFARLEAARPDLHRALRFAADRPAGTGHVLRFAVALRRFWSRRWDDDGMLALLLPVLDRSAAQADRRLFVAAMIAAARQPILGPALGLPLAERAVELARELGDDRLLVEALYALAAKHYNARDFESARVLAADTLQRARLIDDDILVGEGLYVQLMFTDTMDSDDAAQLLAEALSRARRSGDHFMMYAISLSASNSALQAGDLPSARHHVEQAIRAAQQNGGDRTFMAAAQLGSVLRLEGNRVGAQAKFAEALRTSRRTGDHTGLAYSYLGFACTAGDLHDWQRSAKLHGVAQAFTDRTARPWQDLEAGYRRESIDQVLAALGTDEFEQAFAEGMALSFESAFALAIQDTQSGALSGPGSAAPRALPLRHGPPARHNAIHQPARRPRPDRPRFRRSGQSHRTGGAGRILPLPLHPRIPGSVWRDAR
jgi:tetratricopeptide (TPR) repeat protein